MTSLATAQARALAHLDAFLERTHPGFATDKRLHDEARALSHAYTTGAVFSNDAASTLAYLAHFGPRAIAAVSHALTFTNVHDAVVDIGAGSGASALAAVMAGAKSVTLVDSSAKSLVFAQRLLEGTGARVTTHARDATGFVDKNAQLLLSAFAFGELPGEPADAFAALAKCAPNAKGIVVVDAGDRLRSRRLQTARDAIAAGALVIGTAATGGLRNIRGPCAHLEPCPALVRERDWCHARIDKALVPTAVTAGDASGTEGAGGAGGIGGTGGTNGAERLARFARAVGRDDERMSASFLVLDDRPAIGSGGAGAEDVALVVIGDPLKEKGRARLPVCGPGGLRYLQALKRDREAYRALLDVARGARLPLAAAQDVREGTGHVVDPSTLK